MGEEEIIQEAIAKAKEIIQEAGHLGILENKDDLMGEEVKVKKPKKNPSEEPIPKTSNIEGRKTRQTMALWKSVLVQHW